MNSVSPNAKQRLATSFSRGGPWGGAEQQWTLCQIRTPRVVLVVGAKAFKIVRVVRVVHSAFVNNLPGR